MSQTTYFMRECTLTRPDTHVEKSLWLAEDNAKPGRVVNFKEEDFQVDWIITAVGAKRLTNSELAANNIPIT